MKILFLHISDMHVRTFSLDEITYIENMVNAISVVGKFSEIVIILSGDCAYSGTSQEYDHVRRLIGNLKSKLKAKYTPKHYIHIMVVPGNHDMNFDTNSITVDDLNDIYKTNSYDKELAKETDKLNAYYDFSKYNKCFSSNPLYDSRTIKFDNFSIDFRLLNSAVFSIRNGEDKGLHYIPNYILEEYDKTSDADMAVTIMHHSPEWFCDDIKHKLNKLILNKSSIVFFGHEHYANSLSTESDTDKPTLYLCGGALCNKSDWTGSTFFAGVLDTNTSEYINHEFTLSNNVYIHKEPVVHKITLNKNRNLFPLSKDFETCFYKDQKHPNVDNIFSNFIFPRLLDDRDCEVSDLLSFKKLVKENNRLLLVGDYNSGKTILLKYLFVESLKYKVPLYLDASKINNSKMSKIIKREFEDTYGDDNLYNIYEQLPKENKILFFDNIDSIPPKQLELFLSKIEDSFGYYIFSSKKTIELDIFERIKNQLDKSQKMIRLSLAPWYSDKRKELIKKIAINELGNTETVDEIVYQLNLSIRSQKLYFNLNPDFITQLSEFYCKNVSQLHFNDSDAFGKVFEANITTHLQENTTSTINVDKVFTLLGKISYYIHKHHKYPIIESEINEVINHYNDEYGDAISTSDLLHIILESSIMSKESSNTYRFTNNSYLSYFIAKEINNKYNEDRDDTDINLILKYSCFGINSDILLFLIYITDNNRILDLILNITNQFTKEIDEFKLPSNIKYLNGELDCNIKLIDDEDTEVLDKKTIDQERDIVQSEIFSTINIYDYSENESETLLNQIIRAIALLSIVSKCLPFFEHNMKKEKKDAFVNLIYKLPNKIFYLWASDVEKDKDIITQFIKTILLSDFDKQKHIKNDDKLKDTIAKILIFNSTTMLLEIYKISALNSAKESTMPYLNKYDYKSSITYSLEHLIMLGIRGKISDFIDEAGTLLNIRGNRLPSFLVQRIANDVLYNMPNLNRSAKSRLIEKCFPNKDHKSKGLLMAINKKTPYQE